jgi:hypothetical protein
LGVADIQNMHYSVFVDLSRQLSIEERSSIFEALEANVPGSGCVGVDKGPPDEVFFGVEADSEKEASDKAKHYMSIVAQKTGLDAKYTVTLQR